MRAIARRVGDLESWQGGVGAPVRWIRLIVDLGETQEQALARYAATHGPVGADVGIIYRVLVAPDE